MSRVVTPGKTTICQSGLDMSSVTVMANGTLKGGGGAHHSWAMRSYLLEHLLLEERQCWQAILGVIFLPCVQSWSYACIIYIYVSYNSVPKIMKPKKSKNVKETASKRETLVKRVDITLLKIKYQISHEHSSEWLGQSSLGLSLLVVCGCTVCFHPSL